MRGPRRTNGPPNIVFFLVDDLGWADLGCQGSTFYETPRIDRLAEEGMRFTDAYSACPVCSPSRAALMTGKYPRFGRVYRTYHRDRPPSLQRARAHRSARRLHVSATTRNDLGRSAAAAGYVSASIGKWHLGSEQYWPEQQGFDINIAGYDHGSPPTHFFPYKNPGKEWNAEIPTLEGGKPGEYLTDRLTDEAIRFIERNAEKPFFLYLTHYAVHTPLEAPQSLIRKYERKLGQDDSQFSAAYAAMIERVDASLGRVVDTVERLGLRDDTLIVFTSDNGGEQAATRNAPLREGKGYLYEGGVRVPLIVSLPGRVRAGAVSDAPVSGVDIYPTIAELAGERARPGETQGRSLAPLLEADGDFPARDLYWYYPHYSPQAKQPGAALRSGRFKLIEHYDPPGVELYDLENDIGESRNLAKERPGRTAELQRRLQQWIEVNVPIRHRLNPAYDPQVAATERPR